ncbi:MAG TPA: TetR family transcriptional regulator [Streptosporangiaceae bacterium]|nr:TetR family transcriptional regulator [Streptosporangiaceae bacterium]
MEPSVKGGRRAQKALATRRCILDAAEALFVRDGYAATTIAAIAMQADVAVQTVYAVFATKRAILAELLAVRTVGDDNTAHLKDRADWRAMESEADPGRQLALLAAIATRIGERMGALYTVLAGAADSDPEIAHLYQLQQLIRHEDQQRVARSLAQKGALRPGLSPDRATDIMWAIANPTMHQRLVTERQWPPGDYEQWLAHILTCSLLNPGA